ncbi:hypothetical protein B0H19DRAFT_1252116 [Mycena capillaripes]|nr:hypothetical protein B0H19DRAFT_1252116 [Mycena capillaripes]
MLAKLLSYLSPEKTPAWSAKDYDASTYLTGVQYALGAGLADGEAGSPPDLHLPAQDSIRSLTAGFSSPSPWDTLCLGVPFMDGWDDGNPEDSTQWHGQHAFVSMLGKLYVYNVRTGPSVFKQIERYVPDRMRRLEEIVDHDWAAEEKRQAEWFDEPCGYAKPCNM